MAAAEALDDTLAALADPVRRGVVEHLRQRPHRAGELARALGTSAPTMSRHLRVLRRGGLVREAGLPEDGRARVYHLERAPLTALAGWLAELTGIWEEQLASFRAHVEGAAGSRGEER